MDRLDLIVMGEALVDFVPLGRGQLRDTAGFEMHTGGAPCNVAVGAARLGARSALISVVGGDEFAQFILRRLSEEGVDSSGVRVTDEQTGLCFITLDASGERSFLHRGGDAALMLNPADVEIDKVAAAKVSLFSIGALRRQEGFLAVQAFIQHSRGVVCCDPGVCPEDWGEAGAIRARLREALKGCHVIKFSDAECEFVTGLSDPQRAARQLVAEGAALVVITLGPKGALYARAADQGAVAAPVVEVVDTTGAGDAFMSALMVRLAAEVHPAEIPKARLEAHLSFACEEGARAVCHLGAVPPRRSVSAGWGIL